MSKTPIFHAKSVSGARTARASKGLRAHIAAPPDKSASHRSMIFSAQAEGTSRVSNLLESADVLATAKAVSDLGAAITHEDNGDWIVTGAQWNTPAASLDLGNAGTGVRLLMGAVARFDIEASFIGDESLTSRPMARVLDPLALMGVRSKAADKGRLPATVFGNSGLKAIEYTPPIASAQVKSAILLAGLGADGETVVIEPRATRAQTEVMGPLYGADMSVEPHGAGQIARVRGGKTLKACDVTIPGDPSSAAFAIAAALITPDSEVRIDGVMTNPARFGLYVTLQEMGADLTLTPAGERCGEPLVDIVARTSELKGITVPPERAPSMIDEYPILSVIASYAEGTTRMLGLEELRAKESDRLSASAAMLKANQVTFEVGEDTLTVYGMGLGGVPGGGMVATHHDHRLAMSGLVLGLGSQTPASVDDVAMIATSYPSFFDHMTTLGADIVA